MKTFTAILVLVSLVTGTSAQKILLTNDDGWAVAQLRDEYNQLTAAGYQVSSISYRDPTISFISFNTKYSGHPLCACC